MSCLDNMEIGGTELNALRLAEHLDPARFDLRIACLRDDGPLLRRFQEAGLPVYRFPIRSLAGVSAIREGLRLRQLLVRERIQVVHAHDRYTNAFVIPWARTAGVPVAIASKRWSSISRRHHIANSLAYRLATVVLANSDSVAHSLVREDGVPASRIVIVPNFVDDSAFVSPSPSWIIEMRNRLGIGAESTVIGVVANLRPVKDHRTLLFALAEVIGRRKDVTLVLVGSGSEEQGLRELAAQLGIASFVRFAGTMPNKPNLHSLFDVSVLTSLSEGFPNSLIEAMAASRPIVATAVGGITDAVTHGLNGLLVPVKQAGPLARAIDTLLNHSELRSTMGRRGRAIASTRFSASAVMPMLEALYQGDGL
jgi:glycosyltransferase involved in cell wall biosynthesis